MVVKEGLFFLESKENNIKGKRERTLFHMGIIIFIVAMMLIVLLTSARESSKALFNLVFSLSEAKNTYRYNYFDVEKSTSPYLAIFLICVALAGIAEAAAPKKSKAPALFFIIGIVLFEVYFGITPPAFINVVMLLIPIILLANVKGYKAYAKVALCWLIIVSVISVAVIVFVPGVNARIEKKSEIVRDKVDTLEQEIGISQAVNFEEGRQEVRYEGKLKSEEGKIKNAEDNLKYAYNQIKQKIVDKPHNFKLLKTVVIFLMIIMLLTVPFLPFFLINSRRKKTIEKYQKYSSEECSKAICAMFIHIVEYLNEIKIETENRSFSELKTDVCRQMPLIDIGLFTDALELWSESFYSSHEMKEEQRQKMFEALTAVDNYVYNRAGRREKIRLKYILCLHI